MIVSNGGAFCDVLCTCPLRDGRAPSPPMDSRSVRLAWQHFSNSARKPNGGVLLTFLFQNFASTI